jgi:hypothetical protein
MVFDLLRVGKHGDGKYIILLLNCVYRRDLKWYIYVTYVMYYFIHL